MKKLIIILAIAMVVFVISGCASLSQGTGTVVSTAGDVRMEKRGEETATVWFGLFGGDYNYPPIDKVAADNGITKIATVERYRKLGVFGLWADYTTIVTGN